MLMQRLPPVGPTSAGEIVNGFVPTRRFEHVSFDSYEPDPKYPSQQAALDRLRAFSVEVERPINPLTSLIGKRPKLPKGVYLDGGFGVGKTHLLAATYHATKQSKRYLSFAELAYTIARLGMQASLAAFADTRMLCIDEFELDDVAQTRMAAMFLHGLLTRRRSDVHVVTTSNTLPTDLGQGRFAADAFQREIGDIAAYFEVITIDGEDYRHRHWDDLNRSELVDSATLTRLHQDKQSGREILIDWPTLASQLELLHPVHYGQIARQVDALFIRDLERIDDQAVALRLVHLVDKLYDQQVGLTISGKGSLMLSEVFAESYRHGGYEKKYRRCLSRLHELLSETAIRRGRHSSAPVVPLAADRGAPQRDPIRAD
jgi:cell division protein ZapE